MAQSTQREPMGRVDKAWLEMDHETNQMIINGVMLFDAPLTYAAVLDVFAHRMVEQFPRFRQRVVEAPPGSNRFFWEDDPYFDIRAHLLHIASYEWERVRGLVIGLSNAMDLPVKVWSQSTGLLACNEDGEVSVEDDAAIDPTT